MMHSIRRSFLGSSVEEYWVCVSKIIDLFLELDAPFPRERWSLTGGARHAGRFFSRTPCFLLNAGCTPAASGEFRRVSVPFFPDVHRLSVSARCPLATSDPVSHASRILPISRSLSRGTLMIRAVIETSPSYCVRCALQ